MDCRSCARFDTEYDGSICFGMVTPVNLETGEYVENQEVCDEYKVKEESKYE